MLRLRRAIAFFVTVGALAAAPAAPELRNALRSTALDPAECYEVRDLEFSKADAQFYLTSGYLVLGKPVNGAPVTAVFTADTDGGDAEVLLLPPDRSERRSLALYTGSPNLDEHFTDAVFVFTDAELRSLLARVRAAPEARRSPSMGALLAAKWNQTAQTVAAAFESRILLDLLTPAGSGGDKGFFEALVDGRKLGPFDVNYDARAYEQLNAGQVTAKNGRMSWDTWISFTPKLLRGLPPPAPEVKILSYRIEAALNSALDLSCTTHIRIRATGDSRTVLPFDISSLMTATEAKVDGVAAEVFERESAHNTVVNGSELLLVIPPQPLEPGSEHEIEIRHSGKVVVDAGHGVYFVSARGNWYPNRDAQFATYDVTYRYPKNLDLVSAGKLAGDRTEGDERVTRFAPAGRLRLLAFNLGRYERKSLTRDGVEVEVCANLQLEPALQRPISRPSEPVTPIITDPILRSRTRPGLPSIAIPPAPTPEIRPTDGLASIATEIADAVSFFRTRFGPPPLNHIEISPVPGRFGQGFSGMIYVSTLSYVADLPQPQIPLSPYARLFFGEMMRAHEVAHQWWGNVVTTGSYHNEWLMEALANYSALMFLESRSGAKVVDTVLEEYRRELLAKGAEGRTVESEGPVTDGRRLETVTTPQAWTAIVYGKSTWIMHMLRRRMGDAQFLKMIAELRRKYEWRTITTEEFQALCASFLPAGAPDPRLEEFFDVWVYGTGLPSLKLTWSVQGKPGAYILSGAVSQTDVSADFSIRVPVQIQTGAGKAIIRQVRTGSDPATFSAPVASASAKAVLDPAQSVLRR